MTVKVFDAHVHFFDHGAGQYHWLSQVPTPNYVAADNIYSQPERLFLHSDIFPEHLRLSHDLSLCGFTHVEAGFNNDNPASEITHWTNILKGSSLTASFISYLDVTASVSSMNAQIHQHRRVNNSVKNIRGFRCILNDASTEQITRAFPVITAVVENGDLFEWQAPLQDRQKIELLLSVAQMISPRPIVLNHLGLPSTLDCLSAEYRAYLTCLERVARQPNIFVKCSGFDALPPIETMRHLKQVLSDVVNIVDNERLFIASNFPLLQLHPDTSINTFNAYWHTVTTLLGEINAPTQQLTFETAQRLYCTHAPHHSLC